MKIQYLDKSVNSLIGLIFFILFGLTNTIQALTFNPNGAHCDDYSYLNQGVESVDYVATAMKTNADITISEVLIGNVAVFDYSGANTAHFKVELVEDGGSYEPTGTVLATLGTIQDDGSTLSHTYSGLNIAVSAGTVFYLKYTPIVDVYGTSDYIFSAKE